MANKVLPPVARVHWHGDVSWHSTKPTIDSTIKNRFRAGDNSVVLRAAVTEWLRTKYAGYALRYTDGSLSRSGVGIGITGPGTELSLSLSPLCSIFSAEAAAIFIAATVPSDLPILILSDSASVITALQSESPSHPWVQGIQRLSPPSTCFAWIPGHCGIPGNTTADHLAGSGYSGPRYTKKVPLDDVNRWLSVTFKNQWDLEWSQQHTPYLRKIKKSTNRWDDLELLKEQQIISRLRTGHTRLSHDMSGEGPFRRLCSTCGVRKTVEHVLCFCPVYEFPRSTYGLSGSIRDILGDNAASLAAVICFLKDAGLYYQV